VITMKKPWICILVYLFFQGAFAYAGEADVVKVEVKRIQENTYYFDVTVLHEDTGWDHYADKWDVISPDNTILGTRVLLHPHVNEQPFTRSLSNVFLPGNIKKVTIRAHDLIHDYGGKVFTVELP